MTAQHWQHMCVSVINGGRKCMSGTNNGRTCMLSVNGDISCLESTLDTHVNDGCTCIGNQ